MKPGDDYILEGMLMLLLYIYQRKHQYVLLTLNWIFHTSTSSTQPEPVLMPHRQTKCVVWSLRGHKLRERGSHFLYSKVIRPDSMPASTGRRAENSGN